MTVRTVVALALVAYASPVAADPPVTISFYEPPPRPAFDDWFAVDAPLVVMPHADSTSLGLVPSVTVFRDNGKGAIGARFRAGLVSDRMTQEQRPLSTLGVISRIGVRGPWAEVGGGLGQDGTRVGLAVEAGVGWDFGVGTGTVSLSARYVHFDLELGAERRVHAFMAGVGVSFGHTPPPPPIVRPRPGTILTVTVREHASRR